MLSSIKNSKFNRTVKHINQDFIPIEFEIAVAVVVSIAAAVIAAITIPFAWAFYSLSLSAYMLQPVNQPLGFINLYGSLSPIILYSHIRISYERKTWRIIDWKLLLKPPIEQCATVFVDTRQHTHKLRPTKQTNKKK